MSHASSTPSLPGPGTRSPQSAIRNPSLAWQPFTPRGVAAFAYASLSRLLLVEFVVALLAAGAVVWFLAVAWFPTMRAAIRQLPEQGIIRQGELSSARSSPEPLAEGRPFLSLTVDVENQGHRSQSADVAIEFHKSHWQVCSLLGCLVLNYPKDWEVQFNRRELDPWWGA